MNQQFSEIKQKFLGSFKKKGFFTLGRNPSMDWLILLGSFVIFAMVVVSLTLAHYSGVKDELEAIHANSVFRTNILPDKLMESVITYYDGRGEELVEFLHNPPSLVDPSL